MLHKPLVMYIGVQILEKKCPEQTIVNCRLLQNSFQTFDSTLYWVVKEEIHKLENNNGV